MSFSSSIDIAKIFWQMKLFFRLPLMTITFGEAAFSMRIQHPQSSLSNLSHEMASHILFRFPLVLLVETLFLASQACSRNLLFCDAVTIISINAILAMVYFGISLLSMIFGATYGSIFMLLITVFAVASLLLCTHYVLTNIILPFHNYNTKDSALSLDKVDDHESSHNCQGNGCQFTCCNGILGECQSPINIDSLFDKNKSIDDSEFQANPLHLSYPQAISGCSILNNGYTVQVDVNKQTPCTLCIHNKTYTLRQFHFHTPSEHTMNSVQYEMEMHLVHTTNDGEIAVLAFIFGSNPACKTVRPRLKRSPSKSRLVMQSIGEEVDEEDIYMSENESNMESEDGNPFLNQFWQMLPQNKTEENVALDKCLSFDYLFQTGAITWMKTLKTGVTDVDMELFEYVGSLTTPPFTEGVQWLVSHKLHYISPQQLVQLRKCWNNKDNARKVQDLSGRSLSFRRRMSIGRM